RKCLDIKKLLSPELGIYPQMLLHKEHAYEAQTNGKIPFAYRTFCRTRVTAKWQIIIKQLLFRHEFIVHATKVLLKGLWVTFLAKSLQE
ncbi:MAG TPA: hypothetical protein VIG80_10850, partial [Bacillaceae bacterium]